MSLDDYWPKPEERPATARPRPHVHVLELVGDILQCSGCGKTADEIDATARRGRLNRSRGNAIEREVGKKLGLRRTGQFGGKDDLSGELVKAQVKSGGAFSERYWAWLKSIPVDAAQTQLLVVTDAPGPGRKRRGIVVMDLEDYAELYGDATAADL